jgi:NodT family efflux transporter outer membrane factor (OMF) lipoprotein
MKAGSLLAASAALLLGGCDLAPNYERPTVALAAHFKEAPAPSDGVLDATGLWWRSFNDRTLDDLEAQVEAANPDLAAALAANDRARAFAAAAQAGLYPEVDAVTSISANKQSDNRPLRSKNQPTYYGDNQIDAQIASYEIDFWGRVRDLVKAANADAEASADALAQARLGLHAELASAYIRLRGLDAEAKLLSDTIANFQSALELTRSRLAAQIAPPIDVERAETQLDTVKAQATDLAVQRSALENAIAALVGKSAASFSIPRAAGAIAFPKRPRAVPSDVLRRRPDVAESERLAAAESAKIGVARAAFYPKFTLSLLGGTQDTGFNLLSLTNSLDSIGPTVSLPLFDAGLRQAELDAAKAAYAEAAALYRAAILRAVKEVEDDLSALRWLAQEARETIAAAAAARKAADMSMALYRDGAASYLDVVTAQNAALDADRAAIALRTRQLDANVGLMLALGGGWSSEASANNENR